MEESILDSAYALYKEMAKRGLEIRKSDARDNGLFHELCRLLLCPDENLATFLKSEELSAQRFLSAFLLCAKPFSMMFSQIWSFLALSAAPKAAEVISIRFDQTGEVENIELEQFRRFTERTVQLESLELTSVWDQELLNQLFGLSRILLGNGRKDDPSYHYRLGSPKKLPEIMAGNHPLDEVAVTVRNIFQGIINDFHYAINDDPTNDLTEIGLRGKAVLLTDLMPSWANVFDQLPAISSLKKDEAYAFYLKNIEPELVYKRITREQLIHEALDILDLPFWKHRWHTYEIWCTVMTMEALATYHPEPRVTDGRIALDAYTTTVIADLKNSLIFPSACLVIQEQTEVSLGARKGMKPDLRVCFRSESSGRENTAAVIEFKQRGAIAKAHVEEVSEAYKLSAPKSGGTIILNYDQTGILPQLHDHCYFIEGFRPGADLELLEFKNILNNSLRLAGLKHKAIQILLLDISSSMEDDYNQDQILSAIRAAKSSGAASVFFFNHTLITPGPEDDFRWISTEGSTDLVSALEKLSSLYPQIDRLLIVSDRDYRLPVLLLSGIEYMECYPEELPAKLDWLQSTH